jgi:thiosulfate dehydrogenase [quinone] large subunit
MAAQTPRRSSPEVPPRIGAPDTTTSGARSLAVLRISTGFVFVWAFLDKTFGLGYATPAAKAWINGGSPTRGFLSSVHIGPFESAFHAIAGAWWADVLFMLGLLGIGVAVTAGIALRLAAVTGVLLMVLMWLAEFPPALHATDGSPSGSTNPLVDYHIIYALALVALAATRADRTWGFGRIWARLPLVQRHRWAL